MQSGCAVRACLCGSVPTFLSAIHFRGGSKGAISVEQLVDSPARPIAKARNERLSILTKNGRPLLFALPYDERFANEKAHVAIAIRMYEKKVIRIGKAARAAGLSVGEFIDRLGALQIPVIRNPAEDLEREVSEFG